MDRVVVTGAHGMLGRDCVDVLEGSHCVIPLARSQLDITDGPQVLKQLEEIRPDVVVNCAAYTDVDGCEIHGDEARAVNALGPRWLAQASRALGAYLVHVSTDYVFDGQRPPPAPYVEEDAPAPRCVYGRTKWEGEEMVRCETNEHLIVRTGWLYGRHGRSFPSAILSQALQGRRLKVVNDQFGSPTWSLSLARQIRVLMENRVKGTVHATSHGQCSWFQFAGVFLQAMGISAQILPCTTSEFPRPAPRPANSVLENQRLGRLGLDRMPHWREDAQRFVRENGEALRREASSRK